MLGIRVNYLSALSGLRFSLLVFGLASGNPRQTEIRSLDFGSMIGRVTRRIARFTLVVSVSLWMAGAGCMWGCSNMTAAAQSLAPLQDQATVVASASCHAKTHDCCPKGSKKQSSTPKMEAGLSSLLSTPPEGMMKDCPLAIRASAVSTSKSAEGTSDLAISSPLPALRIDQADNLPFVPTVPIQSLNRGPTYLRCCVFLI